MTTALIIFGIVASSLTPTIAILVSRGLDHNERKSVANKVTQVALDAKQTANVQTAKLDEIHVLVNDRLTKALEKIESLQKSLTSEQEK